MIKSNVCHFFVFCHAPLEASLQHPAEWNEKHGGNVDNDKSTKSVKLFVPKFLIRTTEMSILIVSTTFFSSVLTFLYATIVRHRLQTRLRCFPFSNHSDRCEVELFDRCGKTFKYRALTAHQRPTCHAFAFFPRSHFVLVWVVLESAIRRYYWITAHANDENKRNYLLQANKFCLTKNVSKYFSMDFGRWIIADDVIPYYICCSHYREQNYRLISPSPLHLYPVLAMIKCIQ